MSETLTDFLLARIAEDEAAADAAIEPYGVYPDTWWGQPGARALDNPEQDAALLARHDPARVLTECKAKRRIVEGRSGIPHPEEDCDGSCDGPNDHWHMVDEWETLATLAAVYADHPDYRDEWRPTR